MKGLLKITDDRWLSAVLGKKAYRLDLDGSSIKKLRDREPAGCLRELSGIKGPAFIYAKMPADITAGSEFLERLGFSLVDTNVMLEKVPARHKIRMKCPCDIRFAVPDDERGVVDVARRSFVYSRFHLDSAISGCTADRIKAEWARNFFSGGRGEAMVVASDRGRISGFLQLLKGKDGVLTIDQVAVDPRYQRRGIAGAMISYAEINCKGVRLVRVGTQIANKPAMRLYENLGFRTTGASYVFHLHKKR